MSRSASHAPVRPGATGGAVSDASELHETLAAVARFFRRHVRKFTRLALGLVIVAIVLHAVYPPAIELLNHWLGFKEATLPGLLALSLALFITERIVVLEGQVHSVLGRTSIRLYGSRVIAYEEMFAQLGKHGARKLDLLQFSGHNAMPMISRLAMTSPTAAVRLLLAAPEIADRFDTDGAVVHSTRIQATLGDVRVLREDGFPIEARFYDSAPSLAAVIMDDTFAALSWYVCLNDGAEPIPRLRGHNSAAVTAADRDGLALLHFARKQFESIWERARPVELGPQNAAAPHGKEPGTKAPSAESPAHLPPAVVTPGTTVTSQPPVAGRTTAGPSGASPDPSLQGAVETDRGVG